MRLLNQLRGITPIGDRLEIYGFASRKRIPETTSRKRISETGFEAGQIPTGKTTSEKRISETGFRIGN